MPALIARGTQKPPAGALVNPAHPLAQGLLLCVPFNDGCSGTPVNDAITTGWPVPLVGPALTAVPPAMVPLRLAGGVPQWVSNIRGWCSSVGTNSGWQWPTGSWLPATACTVCVVRRKQDTTNRSACLCGVDNGAASASKLAAHVPWSDGVVYWDFGGNSGANRITVSGLSFSTTIPEQWIFAAGPQGSSIWQNGVKVASQSTAITRTAASAGFYLNYGGPAFTGDTIDLNYVAIYNTQWSDELCRQWSAEPYAHLYAASSTRQVFDLGDLSGGASPFRQRRTLSRLGTRIGSRQERL